MLLMYNYVLLKMSTWYSKHVEESNNIWRINSIQCITLVVLYGQKGKSNVFHANMFCATKGSTVYTVKCAPSQDSHKWLTLNIYEYQWPSFKLFEFIEGRNCGHICSGYWLRFCTIRFLRNWRIEKPNNAFCWCCFFWSVIREFYNEGGASDINALKTKNCIWPSVRTSQRINRAWSKNHSPLLQCMWVAFYWGLENNKILEINCAVYVVIHAGASSTQRAIQFYTEYHLHWPNLCINILFYKTLHGSFTTILYSGMFSQFMSLVS